MLLATILLQITPPAAPKIPLIDLAFEAERQVVVDRKRPVPRTPYHLPARRRPDCSAYPKGTAKAASCTSVPPMAG